MLFIYWMIVDIDELNQMFLNMDNFYFKNPNPWEHCAFNQAYALF